MLDLLPPLGELPGVLESFVREVPTQRALSVFGIVGAVIYLSGFTLLQMGRMRGDSIAYAALNTIAALLVLASLAAHFNAGAFIIQVSFAAIGAVSVIAKLHARRSQRLHAFSAMRSRRDPS